MPLLRHLASMLGDRFYNATLYPYLHLKNGIFPPALRMRHPVRFNHKLIWLKMNYRHPDAHRYADKLLVKELVSKAVGAHVVIPTLGSWEDPRQIDFAALPESFVLKANHGSGWNIMVPSKANFDTQAAQRTLGGWLSRNYFDIGREYQYSRISPRILAEPLLTARGGGALLDYKFFCFGGEPQIVQVDFDRFTHHTRNYYSLSWERLPLRILYPNYEGPVARPEALDEMILIARCLAVGFPFIRVDLYSLDGRVLFGELTFHPGGGFEPVTPDEWDRRLGDLLRLPAPSHKGER